MSKFKLGIITDEVSQDMETALQFAKRYGLEAIEIRSLYDRHLHTFSDEEITQLKQLIDQYGLIVCGISSPFFKCHLDQPQEIDEHINILKRTLEIADKLNVRIIRGFSFWNKEDVPFEEALPEIVEQFHKVTDMLEKAKVTLVIEYERSVFARNARRVRALVDAVASPYVQSLYDPGNALGDPEETTFPEGYESLGETLRHIHLKDVSITVEGRRSVAIGEGGVGYRELFQRLLKDGYDGYLVVETHYRLQSKLTEEQLRRPVGNSFSEGGEAASIECVEALLKLLDEVRN